MTEREKILQVIFKHHCTIEHNWGHIEYSAWLRWCYTLKALMCLLLHLKKRKGLSWGDDPVSVCMWDCEPLYGWDGAGHSWRELQVGYGFFRNWWIEIIDNGTC